MDFKIIMLSERDQTQQVTFDTIRFMWNIQNMQIYKNREKISGCQGPGREMDERRKTESD